LKNKKSRKPRQQLLSERMADQDGASGTAGAVVSGSLKLKVQGLKFSIEQQD
jgi:hypothetical protein